MKNNRNQGWICLWLLVIFSMFLAGCQSNSRAQNGSPAEAPRQVTLTLETASPSATPTITETPTPAFTATPRFTPTSVFTETPAPTLTPLPPPFFETFVKSLINGNKFQVVGVYVEGVMALKVLQQPSANPGFVATVGDTATYFLMVKQYTGNTGLLAHNYLAGVYYFDLKPGQSVILIYGDGRSEEYIVSNSDKYQALNPLSPTSNFVSLATGETLTSSDLFFRVYGGGARTTFQTCIAQGSQDSWGRLFVIAPLK